MTWILRGSAVGAAYSVAFGAVMGEGLLVRSFMRVF